MLGRVSLPLALVALTGLVVLLGVLEYTAHVRNLAAIPIRIHVNGTRGKSSVVRLIAGALRAHGLRVFAKATGSLPRMIMDDGTEYPVYRPGRTNVIEQLRVIGVAAERQAEAIVIECMALQPHLQSLCELRMIRATHGVITNTWPDHLDVMGPSEHDVALALAGTTPVGGRLFTAERTYLPVLQRACWDRRTEMVAIGPDEIEAIGDDEMARFSYVEHKENVALALALARSLGVPREVALEGMVAAVPDVGALAEFEIEFFGRHISFVNGFAANDPVATERVWNIAIERHPEARSRILVLNCRLDRPDRSRQLGEALPHWRPADRYFLVGTGTYALARTAVASGLGSTLLVPLEDEDAPSVFEELLGACGASSLVVGAGNIAGIGLDLIKFFRNRAVLRDGEGDCRTPRPSTSASG